MPKASFLLFFGLFFSSFITSCKDSQSSKLNSAPIIREITPHGQEDAFLGKYSDFGEIGTSAFTKRPSWGYAPSTPPAGFLVKGPHFNFKRSTGHTQAVAYLEMKSLSSACLLSTVTDPCVTVDFIEKNKVLDSHRICGQSDFEVKLKGRTWKSKPPQDVQVRIYDLKPSTCTERSIKNDQWDGPMLRGNRTINIPTEFDVTKIEIWVNQI